MLSSMTRVPVTPPAKSEKMFNLALSHPSRAAEFKPLSAFTGMSKLYHSPSRLKSPILGYELLPSGNAPLPNANLAPPTQMA